MIINKQMELKKKLRHREKVFGAWTSIGHPSITEILSQSGVDFIGIDIEHSTISQEQSQRIIAASQAEDVLCLPRIASHNMEAAKRLFDSGADGVIVPMVSFSEQVGNIIQWSKYPPVGNRSFGVARAQSYGLNFDKYVQSWNESSIIIIQIESGEGIENIDKLLSYSEIDGAMIGPYDISGSLGIPGQLDHPKVIEATKKVIIACEKHGKACGTQVINPNLENIEAAFSSGYTFVVLASDVFILWKWSERMEDIIDSYR